MSNNLDKVPAHVLALAAKAEEALSYDDEGTGVLPESFFDDHVGELSEGLTGALVRQAQSAEMDFADALLLAHGRSRTNSGRSDGKACLAAPLLPRARACLKASSRAKCSRVL